MTIRSFFQLTLDILEDKIRIVPLHETYTSNGLCLLWNRLINYPRANEFLIIQLKECMRLLSIKFYENRAYIFKRGDTAIRANALREILNSENENIRSILSPDLSWLNIDKSKLLLN
jgi:hypothetical protein